MQTFRKIFARLKILYSRITLTRITTSYFLLAVFTCLALTASWTLTFIEDSVELASLNPTKQIPIFGIPIFEDEELKICPNLPDKSACRSVIDFDTAEGLLAVDEPTFPVAFSALRRVSGNITTGPVVLDLSYPCLVSLKWWHQLLQDNQREDITSLIFDVYILNLSVFSAFTESIPHLCAAVVGHIMGAIWAIYRLFSMNSLRYRYLEEIVPFACGGVDVFDPHSWDVKIQRAILMVAVRVVALPALLYLSCLLFKVYQDQTFSRVGTTPNIHRMSTVTMIFICKLQLVNFFCPASAVLWIHKLSHLYEPQIPKYFPLFVAAFIVIMTVHLPLLLLGRSSIETESRVKFRIFTAIAFVLLGISMSLFLSPLYRYTFLTWPFFTTVTCTAFTHLFGTMVLALACRLNFGKGLAHYLHVTRVLEGIDFPPEYFSKREEDIKEKQLPPINGAEISLPSPVYQTYGSKPERDSWMYSAHNVFTVQFSSTPPLLSDIGPVPPRFATAKQV